MKRISILMMMLLLLICNSKAQITTTFKDNSAVKNITRSELGLLGGDKTCATIRVVEVKIYNNCVDVVYEVKAAENLRKGLYLGFADNGYLSVEGGELKLPVVGQLSGDNLYSVGRDHQRGWSSLDKDQTGRYTLRFKGHIPQGVTQIEIKPGSEAYYYETLYAYCTGYYSPSFFCFRLWGLNNPRKGYYESLSSASSVKQNINSNNDGVCGIYESIGEGVSLKIACVKMNGEYCLIHMNRNPSTSWWQMGDIKAWLTKTPSGIYKSQWRMWDKSIIDDCYITFDGYSMTVTCANLKSESMYLKTYPSESPTIGTRVGGNNGSEGGEWTGTGFALKNGYIVTNNHVVDGAKSIVVLGVNGNTSTEYKAKVVGVDKNNDLALIKIDDYHFRGFTNVPYAVPNKICEVGADVFVLGYPLTTYMGEEIKLTNGIISSKTGYQGDVSTYQISAPVQPGNSGGPLFDNKGNVIGIVNAGIPGAENVGYAIKTSYLYNLIQSVAGTSIIPQSNSVTGTTLAEKVRQVKNCVFFIKCKGN